VAVYYLPDDPNVSVIGSPRRVLVQEGMAVAWAILILPLLAAFYVRFQARKTAAEEERQRGSDSIDRD
jgi:hypothetical protein